MNSARTLRHTKRLLSFLLTTSLALDPLLYANAAAGASVAPGTTQTGGSGSNGGPPKDPRKFKDPAGDANRGARGRKLDPKHKFNDYFGPYGKMGDHVFYTGLTDAQGNPHVYRLARNGLVKIGLEANQFAVFSGEDKAGVSLDSIKNEVARLGGRTDGIAIAPSGEVAKAIAAAPDANADAAKSASRTTGPGSKELIVYQPKNLEVIKPGSKDLTLYKPPGPSKPVAGFGIAAFYFAMGMVAFYELMRYYPNNPVVWEQFKNSLTDPIGLMMVVGFVAVASPFLSKVGGFSQGGGPVVRMIPLAAAGLAIGTLAQGLIYYSANEDVQKCIGVRDFMTRQGRDEAACARARDALTTESVSLTFVPPFVNLLGIFGVLGGTYYLSSVAGLTAWLYEALPFLGGGVGKMVTVVAGVTAYLALNTFSEHTLAAEKKIRELMLTTFSFSGSVYGGNISTVQNNLFKGWSTLKKNGFQDRDAARTNCSDLETDCPTYDDLDFRGVLKRYTEVNNLWRNVQMAPTLDAYKNWVARILGYHLTLNASYNAYRDFVGRISRERNDVPVGEAGGFNPAAIKALIKASEDKKEVFTTQDTTSTWRYVSTPHFYDYIVASMACGPEAEGYTSGSGVVDTVSNFVSTYITRNSTPTKVIDNRWGQSILFSPPRIIENGDGVAGSICQTRPNPGPPDIVEMIPGTSKTKYSVDQFHPRTGWFWSEEPNLYAYIKDHVRPAVLEGGDSHFDAWWKASVSTQVKQTEAMVREEYQEMLDQIYKPAMTRQQYEWCKVGKNLDPNVARYMAVLNSGANPGCLAADATDRLADGVWNSLSDEMTVYLAFMLDAEISGQGKGDADKQKQLEDALLPLARETATSFRALSVKLSETRPSVRGSTEEVTKHLNESFLALRQKVSDLNAAAPLDLYQPWVAMLSDNAALVMESATANFVILTNFDSEGAG